ncbi:MAG: hypothetical protein JWL72_4902 [Ilumatobacteraceae bacterium]|nr:hypothetical protein [Ilumatobacteraceae bacterium]
MVTVPSFGTATPKEEVGVRRERLPAPSRCAKRERHVCDEPGTERPRFVTERDDNDIEKQQSTPS